MTSCFILILTLDKNYGAAYVYKLELIAAADGTTTTTWVLLQSISSVLGMGTYFGFSVDIYSTTIVIGANGYRTGVYDPQHSSKYKHKYIYYY